jgi:hypothetical protein
VAYRINSLYALPQDRPPSALSTSCSVSAPAKIVEMSVPGFAARRVRSLQGAEGGGEEPSAGVLGGSPAS